MPLPILSLPCELLQGILKLVPCIKEPEWGDQISSESKLNAVMKSCFCFIRSLLKALLGCALACTQLRDSVAEAVKSLLRRVPRELLPRLTFWAVSSGRGIVLQSLPCCWGKDNQPQISACRIGHITVPRSYLCWDVSVTFGTRDFGLRKKPPVYFSPMHLAAQQGKTEILKALLHKGCDIDPVCSPSCLPGQLEGFLSFRSPGCEPNCTPLYVALDNKQADAASMLIHCEASLAMYQNQPENTYHSVLLQAACYLGLTNLINILLEDPEDPIFECSSNGLLVYAYIGTQWDCFRYLVNDLGLNVNDARVRYPNASQDFSLLEDACNRCDWTAVNTLIDCAATLDISNEITGGPLHWVIKPRDYSAGCTECPFDILIPLIRKGAPVRARDQYLRTPLHLLVSSGSSFLDGSGSAVIGNVITELLRAGADPTAYDSAGQTPLMCATRQSGSAAGEAVRSLTIIPKVIKQGMLSRIELMKGVLRVPDIENRRYIRTRDWNLWADERMIDIFLPESTIVSHDDMSNSPNIPFGLPDVFVNTCFAVGNGKHLPHLENAYNSAHLQYDDSRLDRLFKDCIHHPSLELVKFLLRQPSSAKFMKDFTPKLDEPRLHMWTQAEDEEVKKIKAYLSEEKNTIGAGSQ
ncbi:hypothetical protein PG995_004797 [Apiospora arundinis]